MEGCSTKEDTETSEVATETETEIKKLDFINYIEFGSLMILKYIPILKKLHGIQNVTLYNEAIEKAEVDTDKNNNKIIIKDLDLENVTIDNLPMKINEMIKTILFYIDSQNSIDSKKDVKLEKSIAWFNNL